MEKLTRRQDDVLKYIKEFMVSHGYPPTIREIGSALGISSPATIHSHLKGLEDKGFIITDNMKFHGYVDMPEEEIKNRNLRGLVRKIKEYKTYLEENDKYETEFSDIGDGLAISTPRID